MWVFENYFTFLFNNKKIIPLKSIQSLTTHLEVTLSELTLENVFSNPHILYTAFVAFCATIYFSSILRFRDSSRRFLGASVATHPFLLILSVNHSGIVEIKVSTESFSMNFTWSRSKLHKNFSCKLTHLVFLNDARLILMQSCLVFFPYSKRKIGWNTAEFNCI